MTGHDPGDQPQTAGDPFREWDAAYVLGALDPADRRAFEHHLRTCASCRESVAELAGMPGMLRMVPADEASALGGDPAVEVVELASVARSVHRDRRRRSAVLVGAAAGLLLLGGAAGVVLGTPDPAPVVAAPSPSADVTALRLEPVGAAAVSADLTLQEKRWGTRIDWDCRYPSEASLYGTAPTYELVLVDDDGASTVVATWAGGAAGARGLGASSSIATDSIRRVEIRVQGADEALAAGQT